MEEETSEEERVFASLIYELQDEAHYQVEQGVNDGENEASVLSKICSAEIAKSLE